MKNIYVTRRIPDAGLKLLQEKFGKFDMNEEDRVLTPEELKKAVAGRDGVLCLLTDKIDASIYEAAGKQCKIFSNYAVGFNNIDIPEATKRGVLITNTPGVLTEATADLAITLLFAAARRIVEGDAFTRAGKYKGWGPLLMIGQDITGRTLGIIGAGRIGSNVAMKMAKGFGMKILYTDKFGNTELEKEVGARKVPLDELLKESDFVSVHVNLTEETRHLMSAREFGLMKPSGVFVNTSRGPVVDEKALVEALRKNTIFAAGLDVFEDEPLLAPGLAELTNVIIPPHVASATFWTRSRMAEMAAKNLIDALEGKTPEFCVNTVALGI